MRTFWIVVSAIVVFFSMLGWAWLSGMGVGIGVNPPNPIPQIVIAYVLPGTGLAAGLAIGMLAFQFSSFSSPREPAAGAAQTVEGAEGITEPAAEAKPSARPEADRMALLLGVAIAASAILLLVAAAMGKIAPVPAALIIICGTLTLFAGMHVVAGLARGEAIEVTSHWGGLGGAMGGWRLSSLATLMVVGLVLLGTTIAASGALSGQGNEADSQQIQAPPVTGIPQAGTANALDAATRAVPGNLN